MIALLAALPIQVWDFAVSNGGFVPSGDGAEQWEHGVATSGPGGPGKVWGTNLSGPYLNDATDHLEVPMPSIGGADRPMLVVRHWFDIEPGDFATFEVDPGTGWVRVDPIYGYPESGGFTGTSEWSDVSIDLSGYGTSPRVRLTFAADTAFAADGWYIAQVSLWDGDTAPPLVAGVVAPRDTQDIFSGYLVQVHVQEDDELASVDLTFDADGVETTIAMTPMFGGVWQATIPVQPPDTVVTWSVAAEDAGGNVTVYPAGLPESFRVFLAAPTGVTVETADRGVGDSAAVTWERPDTPHAIGGYRLQDVAATLDPIDVVGASATLHLDADSPQEWHVAAIYASGVGDWSEPFQLGLEVPDLVELSPKTGVQGDALYVRLEGSSLYLLQSSTELDLGEGVDVGWFEVFDANTLEALVLVDPAAEPGPRDVVVTGAQGTFTFADAFEILDASDGPAIVSVDPGTARQGEDVVVTVVSNVPFGPTLTVQLDDDLLLTAPPTVSENRADLPILVQTSAAPGEHTLILDDGVRQLSASLVVEERVYAGTHQGCASVGGSGFGWAGWPWLGLLLLVGRRARDRR